MDAAVSAIRAGGVRLGVSAHNLANVNTSGFTARRAIQREQAAGRGTSIYAKDMGKATEPAVELIEQKLSQRYVQFNGAVIRTEQEMQGELLDLLC